MKVPRPHRRPPSVEKSSRGLREKVANSGSASCLAHNGHPSSHRLSWPNATPSYCIASSTTAIKTSFRGWCQIMLAASCVSCRACRLGRRSSWAGRHLFQFWSKWTNSPTNIGRTPPIRTSGRFGPRRSNEPSIGQSLLQPGLSRILKRPRWLEGLIARGTQQRARRRNPPPVAVSMTNSILTSLSVPAPRLAVSGVGALRPDLPKVGWEPT